MRIYYIGDKNSENAEFSQFRLAKLPVQIVVRVMAQVDTTIKLLCKHDLLLQRSLYGKAKLLKISVTGYISSGQKPGDCMLLVG